MVTQENPWGAWGRGRGRRVVVHFTPVMSESLGAALGLSTQQGCYVVGTKGKLEALFLLKK